MRIVVSEFRQESNSLNPNTSTFDHWNSGWMLRPEDLVAQHDHEESAVRGILEVLGQDPEVSEIIPGPAYYSQSGGTAEQEVMDQYLKELLGTLHAMNGIPDAIIFSFHGALQTTEYDDAEAETVRRVREAVGNECIIATSMDLHGFISRKSAEQIDIICGYHTYPHTDFVETGRRAARLCLQAIHARRTNKSSVKMAWAPVPMMVSASAYNTLEGTFADLFKKGNKIVEEGDILDFSIFQMQPWLDVDSPCSAILTIGTDSTAVIQAASNLALSLYEARHQFEPKLLSIGEIIDRASSPDSIKPVILVDSADSPNAGAPGDSMAVAAEAAEQGANIRIATVVQDPTAVTASFEAGVSADLDIHLGGAYDTRAKQLDGPFYVKSLHDGTFKNSVVGSAGAYSRLGRAAVLTQGSIDILVCEHLVSPGDPQLYSGFGMPQHMYDLVVVKANTSFRAAYQPISGEIWDADSPGAAGPNIRNLPFAKIPRSIYPWVDRDFSPEPQILRGASSVN